MTTFYYKIQNLNKLFLHSASTQYIRVYRCVLCIYKHNLVVPTSSEENREYAKKEKKPRPRSQRIRISKVFEQFLNSF